ncbi:MAG: nucleotidyl transferase AbiEii/AbiGii toxin family protein [Candidatus Paceibacterota bacterium]|jgi:predicted nucleotidyltransferase component of viral defense system
MISKAQINEFSKRLAIDEFTIIREYIQVVFLSVFYSTAQSQKVYFKGGTAIRLLLKSGRFSEDLDFTAELTAKELDPLVNETVKKMSAIIPDMTLKRTEENKFSYTGILSYHPEGTKQPLNIHLDFSLREKPETSKETVLESDFPVVPLPVVRHMDWQEILAEKIRAFLYRLKGRDVYDLWVMLQKGVELDWEMINRKTALYKMETSLQDLMDRIGHFEDKKLKNDLAKFLPARDRHFVDQLKALTMSQLVSRQGFTIARSENLDYTTMPGGSFSGTDKLIYDLKKTKVISLKRQDENSIHVMITNEDDQERSGYIRARTRNGVRELDVIELNTSALKGKSYDDLINHEFKS